MPREFDTEKQLETRHFIQFDQMNAQQKIASLKKLPLKLVWRQKLKTFLRRLFKQNERNP
jgi:hypothetical protein